MIGRIKQAVRNMYKAQKLKKTKNIIVNAKHDVSKLDKSKLFDARKYGFSFS